MDGFIEPLVIEIDMHRSRDIIVGVTYRPPQFYQKDFLTNLQNVLSNPALGKKQCFSIEEFTINFLEVF